MKSDVLQLEVDETNYLSLVRQALLRDAVANHLDEDLLNQYLERLAFSWVKAGETIMQQGDPSDFLTTVILGRVKVEHENEDGDTKTLTLLGHGQTVGEMGLVTEQPRSASVIAQRDTLLATLSRDSFEQLLQRNPVAFNKQFVKPIINRLHDQVHGITPTHIGLVTMLLLPTAANVDVEPIAASIADTLNGGIASCLHLNKAYLEAHMGQLNEENETDQRRISEWLGREEIEHDVVIYTADPTDSLWLKRCLRQSDKIVLVGDGATKPLQSDWVPGLQYPEAAEQQRVLLLLQPHGIERPQGTETWLETFDVAYYYHLQHSGTEHLQRVARLLANRGIGLVLTGGGARGIAHIGLMRRFKEHQIPFDVICGSSSGTVISTGLANGWAAETFAKYVSKPPKFKYTIPFSALTAGHGVQAWLDQAFGKLRLEDIWKPNFFPIYNMRTSRLETCDRGQASIFVRAAMALPGLCPPYVKGHDVYLDGGVANYLPIDIMRDRTDIQTVIAVDIVSDIKGKKDAPPYAYDGLLSGWKVLLNRINPFSKRLRYVNIGKIMFNSILVAGIQSHRLTRDMADYKIRLVVNEVGLLDFHRLDDLVELGYAGAHAQIESSGLLEHFRATEA